MPTIEQLVRNGRTDKVVKSKSPSLGVGFNSLEKKYTEIFDEYDQIKDTTNLFDPYPEVAHRLADIYINDGLGLRQEEFKSIKYKKIEDNLK